MGFVGRVSELESIDKQYKRDKATFLIVYGRRRIGKTRLLIHWLRNREVEGFYWVATQTSNDVLLSSFSTALHKFLTGHDTNTGFTYGSWEDALKELVAALKTRTQKMVVMLDEFTYAMEADTSLASVLQKWWDHELQFLPIFLVISGSHVGMMERQTITYRAPLYGRATGRLHLRELPFKHLKDFFPKYSIEERVAAHAILGGIPYYIDQFDPNVSLSENIKRYVLEGDNLLQEEPRLLMHEQVQEPRHYLSILHAIAQGKNGISEIGLEVGLSTSTTGKYIATMVNLGLLHRDVPATIRHPEQSRKGRYRIKDNYLRFYFRFINPRLSEIATGMNHVVLDYIKEHFRGFVGTYAFEDLCRQYIVLAGATRKIPFSPETVGSHWSKTEQIDVVGINWQERQVIFGECKWSESQLLSVDVVDKLVKQTQSIIPKSPKKELFTVHYAYFSRAGFTDEARQKIAEMKGLAVDLEEFERMLDLTVL